MASGISLRHLELERHGRELVLAARQDQGGAGDRPQAGAAVGAVHDGGLLAQEAVLAGALGHALDGGHDLRVAQRVGVDEQRQEAGRDALELALLRQLHQAAAAGLGLVGVGAGLGVEQGQAGDALGCPAQDLEGDVAAHGEADQREAGRGGGEDVGGEAGDGIGAGQVGHRHLHAGGEGRELAGVQTVVAEQARQEEDRVGHGGGSLSGSAG